MTIYQWYYFFPRDEQATIFTLETSEEKTVEKIYFPKVMTDAEATMICDFLQEVGTRKTMIGLR